MPDLYPVNVFLSCPGDVVKDKTMLKKFLEGLNAEFERKYNVELQIITWEEQAPQGPVSRGQKGIDDLVENSDIYLGFMANRFGGNTGLFLSGTYEEFAMAFRQWEKRKKIHMRFYFKDVAVSPAKLSQDDFAQLARVREFREMIRPNFIYGNYKKPAELCEQVRIELDKILPTLKPAGKKRKPAITPVTAKSPADALTVYYRYLQDKYNRIQVFQNADFELEKIYVSLRLEANPELLQHLGETEARRKGIKAEPGGRLREVAPAEWMAGREAGAQETGHKPKELSIDDILASTAQAVILGEPGAGKTTLFKHLIAKNREPDDPWLPVFLPVKFWLQCGYCRPVEAFIQWLQPEKAFFNSALLAALLSELDKAWHDNRVMLLLDGLDEIGQDDFNTACEHLNGLTVHDNKVLLSCRRASYQHRLSRERWAVFSINPFNQWERRQFMDNYFVKQPALADQLYGLVEGRPRLCSLAQIPLLLGLLCYIYEESKQKLPEDRIELYERCVDELLRRRADQRFVSFQDFKKRFLATLAFHFFSSANVKEREWFSAEEILELLRREIQARRDLAPALSVEHAALLLNELVEANGLLLPAGADHYCFPHRSFQEYFSARYLDQVGDGQARIIATLCKDDFWNETICLYAGLQPNATALINDLGKKDRVDLAIRVIPEAIRIDWDKLDEKLNWKIRRSAVERLVLPEPDRSKIEDTVDLLRGILLRKPDPNANVRYSALLALEKIGNEEAKAAVAAACIIPPKILQEAKPFTYEARGNQFEINLPGMPPNMVLVPSNRKKSQKDFFLGIFPVTNWEFQRFIDDKGYQKDEYWSKEGQKAKKAEKWKVPRWWDDVRFNHPWQPVVGVSFYEAEAYCRWLTESSKADRPFRIPREEEWEHAAKGADNDEYAFGSQWNQDIPRWDSFNDYEKGLTYGSSRVNTVYKECVSGYGLFDMAGNVWEWTDSRVLRGGSWYDDFESNLRSAYRSDFDPFIRGDIIGFRCLQDSR